MSIKVQVTGTSAAAGMLRQHLMALGYAVVERGGRYSVRMDTHNPGGGDLVGEGWGIELEGSAGQFADEVQRAVAELCGRPVCWRDSEELKATELRLVVPCANRAREDGGAIDETGHFEDAAARGVLRAILKLTGHGEPAGWRGEPSWLRKQNWQGRPGWWHKFKGRNGK